MRKRLLSLAPMRMNRLILVVILFALSACAPTAAPPLAPIVVTATPDLAATIEALSRSLTVEPTIVEPPTVEPPTVEPPTVEPPTVEPPTVEPPTMEPPTMEPPTVAPPTLVLSIIEPTAIVRTIVEQPTVAIPFGVVSAPSSVNVRSGPDTEYPILRVSARGTRLEVVGRSVDGQWWQVRVPDIVGGLGWVSTLYLETRHTANVPMVSAPPLPTRTPAPTSVPPTRPPTPPLANSLDLRAPAIYGSYNIYPTFDSQTVDISVTGGGSINVRNAGLPSFCTGYVSAAPDVEINLQSSASDLYIYFLSDSDATLIVNDPFGNWYCDDDSYGRLNPMVVFRGARAGVYDIWVGRYDSSGLTQRGILKIGEMHP